MNRTVAELSEHYYREFASGGDFASVPMAKDLRFKGPLHAYSDGERYRRDCIELAALGHGIEIRYQFVEGD